MDSDFRFGLEAEFMLSDAKTFRPLWYRDVTFKTLDRLLTNISLEGIPDLNGLSPEPPHEKLMPFIVEGYGIPDKEMKIIDAYPKGVEIRTPVCNSVEETLEVYETLYHRVREALSQIGVVPTAISHHPLESTFSGPQSISQPSRLQEAWETLINEGFGALIDQSLSAATSPNKGLEQKIKPIAEPN
ncbi:hypothetical protein EBU94_09525, partial [bacterium]|nr:hypothetical protein [bacterium]